MSETKQGDVFEIRENCLLIRLPKEIDHHNTRSIREGADLLMCDNRVQQVIFDFKETTFMDSSGIGLLAGRNEKITFLGGRTIVMNTNPRIRRLLQISGVDHEVCILEEEVGNEE